MLILLGTYFTHHLIFGSEVLTEYLEDFLSMLNEITAIENSWIDRSFGYQMIQPFLKRVVKASHKDLRLVITDTEFLFYEGNGIFQIGANPPFKIDIGLGSLGKDLLSF